MKALHPTFFWRFRQNKTTSTSSRMMPIPTMSKGKLDTTVTMRSSCLICTAESSSIVAVWGRGEKSVLTRGSFTITGREKNNSWGAPTSLTNMMGKMVSLMCFVLLKGRKKKTKRSEKNIWHNMWSKCRQCGNGEAGRSSANLREAGDSLQNDIELSSLTGTNGNPCGLKGSKKDHLYDRKLFTHKTQFLSTVFAGV